MPDFVAGELILVDKPSSWTSFDVVNKLRYQLRDVTGVKKIKVGHAGTLDPLATGLLILCTGKKTKTIDAIQAQEKEYTGIIQLGATTASYDLETAPENIRPFDHLTEEDIRKKALSFVGKMAQVPPIFSARKVDGKRAYALARKGETPEMPSKEITILAFEIEKIDLPDVHFRIACSKGTYIRSIAHDFGQSLEVGGFLKALRRTKIGTYEVGAAKSIEDSITYIAQHSTV